ncbi:Helix-turn-helix domain-containing protein [Streptomyces sp. 3213]|uniref:peptidoglycan-binding protein n=1 Tax=Streptomyces sp. 3213.3 TaxID=1855348 RepID=UPI0008995D50|nr:peptidoglycan-binding protein [Streptomyces sp. 3213.3]SEF02493.1 Helix-turn-helix domain-containing protein [Streptomyces sp. 3213] [Streptomyces sp. 3213.3]
MGRWKALPSGLDPTVVEFVAQLRRFKDASGLSLRVLAARTGYSASSWNRYLGGRSLPPREAVEALAATVGADPTRLLVRLETAQGAWGFEQAVGAPVSTEEDGAPGVQEAAGGGHADGGFSVFGSLGAAPLTSRLRLLLTVGVSAAAGAAITLLAVELAHPQLSGTATRPAAVARPVPYTCDYVRKSGLWYAGNSTTRKDHLEVDMSGPEVAELQCLLQRAGISPGGVDGNFGPLTESAVIKAQKTYRLGIDGQVGPQTWTALRR